MAVRMDVRIGLMLRSLHRTLPRLFPLASGTRARLAPVGTMSPAVVRAARIATFTNGRDRPPRSPASPRSSSRSIRRPAARGFLR